MRPVTARIRKYLIAILLLSFSVISTSTVYALNFNALWDYRQSGGEDIETRDQFSQRYSLGVGPSLNYQPSHAISASAGVSYTKNRSGDESSTTDNDTLSPFGRLSLINDIFLATLSGNSNHSYKNAKETTKNSNSYWDTTLRSAWNVPFWPNLGVSYSEQKEFYDSDNIFDDANLRQRNFVFHSNWDLEVAELNYNFRKTSSQDRDSNIEVNNKSHFVRFDTSGSFWQRRLNFTLGQQFQYTKSEVEFKDFGGTSAGFPLEGVKSDAITDPDIVPDPLPGETWSDAQLNLQPSSGIYPVLPPGMRINLAFNTDLEQEIQTARIVVDFFTSDKAVENLRWDLYLRASPTTWALSVSDIPGVTFDSASRDIIIPIDIFEREFMLVAVNNSSDESIRIVEFEIFGILSQENTKQTNKAYLTNFGLNYQLTQTISGSFNTVLEHTEVDGEQTDLTVDRRSLSGNVRWNPTAFLSQSIGASEFFEERTGAPDFKTRTYYGTLSTFPLPAVNVSLGVSYIENFEDDLKYSESTNYSLTGKAPIYPDLTSTYTLTYNDGNNLDETTNQVFNTTSLTNRLTLMAQLYRSLSADFVASYTHTDSEQNGKVDNGKSVFGLRYRPSDILSARASYTAYFADDPKSDEINIGTTLRLIQTYKTRFTLATTHIFADQTSHNFSAVSDWNISSYFNLQFKGNYRIAESGDRYNFYVTLSFRL